MTLLKDRILRLKEWARPTPSAIEAPVVVDHVPVYPFRQVAVSDEQLAEVNSALDWRAGTLLGGRLLGRLGVTPGKRVRPAPIPDRRIVELHNRIGLKGLSVLEVGCFEGIHTLGLRLFTDNVTAVDVRPSNVLKTLARLSLHGSDAKVFVADAEKLGPEFGKFDLVFHCGVLYHLHDPVEHLLRLAPMAKRVFLDTHVAREGKLERRVHDGWTYEGSWYAEKGWGDPFSGRSDRSFWLSRESLFEVLRRAGFTRIETLEDRAERNGPRVALLASREKPS